MSLEELMNQFKQSILEVGYELRTSHSIEYLCDAGWERTGREWNVLLIHNSVPTISAIEIKGDSWNGVNFVFEGGKVVSDYYTKPRVQIFEHGVSEVETWENAVHKAKSLILSPWPPKDEWLRGKAWKIWAHQLSEHEKFLEKVNRRKWLFLA